MHYDARFTSTAQPADFQTLNDRNRDEVALVRALGLHKGYGDKTVLCGVSMEVHAGDVISLIGERGAGKSTLLRCLNLLERPEQGRLFLGNEEVPLGSEDSLRCALARGQLQRIRRRVAMVFERPSLWAHLTALGNVMQAPLTVLAMPRGQAQSVAEECLSLLDLQDLAERYPTQLSVGQQQRVSLARALAMGPDLLLIDDPTSLLEGGAMREVLKTVRLLITRGSTVVLATHELGFAREVSTRVMFLQGGRIAAAGHPDELLGWPPVECMERFLFNRAGAP